jgi:hypothetical protein
MDLTQKRIYFWGGIFSQWAKCDIFDPSLNKTFNCAEQAMMYYKAMTFQDGEAMREVFKEKDPRNQKAIGRTIKNYDDEIWNEVKYNIVVRNNRLKFLQNPAWRELLIYTDGYDLVEASPYDKIWGVGLGEDNPDILDKSKWKGENLLGKAINDARVSIIEEL